MGVRTHACVVGLVLGGLSIAIPSSAERATAARHEAPKTCVPREKCCEICSVGKACGKSCIQATKTCHKGRGCACNVAEVCAD